MLTDKEVLELFWKDMESDKWGTNRDINPEFKLEDLVGKIIVGIRKIKNPAEYSKSRDPNPPFYSVLEFNDGDMLLTELIDYQDGTLFGAYLYNRSKNKVLFTRELFR